MDGRIRKNSRDGLIDKKVELREIISLMRNDDYGIDLGKEIYVFEKDVYKVLKSNKLKQKRLLRILRMEKLYSR